MRKARSIAILAILAVFFAGFLFSVTRMERLRANGIDALLPLAPVDPRALLMGDYMALDYAVNNAIRDALRERDSASWPDGGEGRAVLKRAATDDGRGKPGPGLPFPAASFVRLDDGAPLGQDEMRLAFTVRGGRVMTASPAFYFREGDACVYARARYGRVKADGGGKTLLVALCDEAGRDLRPERGE